MTSITVEVGDEHGIFQGLFNRKLDNPITNDYLKSENNSLKLNIMKLERSATTTPANS